MREWFSIKYIVSATGISRQAVEKKSVHWLKRKKATGKGFEYHISSLPVETQNALRQQNIVESANKLLCELESSETQQRVKAYFKPDLDAQKQADKERLARKQKGLAAFAALPNGPKKARAKARHWVIDALWSYRRTQQGGKQATRVSFVELFNNSEVAAPAWVLEQMPKFQNKQRLTVRSLCRWEDGFLNNGIMFLVDNYGQSRGNGKIDQNIDLQKVVLGAIFNQPHVAAGKILDYIHADCPEHGDISKRSIQRYIKNWKEDNQQLWTYITNPDQWKNVYMAVFGSHHEDIIAPNQLWEMDSTPGDWMLIDGRHSVIGVIDMFTRRLKLLVSKTSIAEAVKQVLRRAVLVWGVPVGVRTDNGKDYVSYAFTSVLLDLEIDHHICMPFASEQKGTIERALGIMSHGLLDLLPGFIGHNVAERKAIEARKSFAQRIMTPDEVVDVAITSSELQEKLDLWADHIYALSHPLIISLIKNCH